MALDSNDLPDEMIPIYEFERDGTTRTTEHLATTTEGDVQLSINERKEAIETLVMLGREDPSCEVRVIGWSN
jgi:hypothetical protein